MRKISLPAKKNFAAAMEAGAADSGEAPSEKEWIGGCIKQGSRLHYPSEG
ncbi:MAG: hypothetical protein KH704_04620 [Clostridiales bacterium]|nr:hypothetical protein [Clostridiales bacterium]